MALFRKRASFSYFPIIDNNFWLATTNNWFCCSYFIEFAGPNKNFLFYFRYINIMFQICYYGSYRTWLVPYSTRISDTGRGPAICLLCLHCLDLMSITSNRRNLTLAGRLATSENFRIRIKYWSINPVPFRWSRRSPEVSRIVTRHSRASGSSFFNKSC